MNRAGRAFAAITAALEDMHGIAVAGQHPSLTRDEGQILIVALRAEIVGLNDLTRNAERTVRRAKT